MVRKVALILAMTWSVSDNPAADAQSLRPDEPVILLAMCDKVGLSETSLEQAMASAAKILSETGARTVWIRSRTASPITTFDYDSYENCEIPSNDYILVVVTAEQPKGHPIDLMGLAPRTNVYQRRTYILYPRVESFVRDHRPATRRAAETAIVLGSVIAHEVGHLLMPGKKHAVAGVMRSDWGYREARDAISRRLTFTGDELMAIRQYLFGNPRHAVQSLDKRTADTVTVEH